jgi:protein phosphatase
MTVRWAIVYGSGNLARFYSAEDSAATEGHSDQIVLPVNADIADITLPNLWEQPSDKTQPYRFVKHQGIETTQDTLACLDAQRRYRFLQPLSTGQIAQSALPDSIWEIQGQVLDHYPSQGTAFAAATASLMGASGSDTPIPLAFETLPIVPLAQPYLVLHARFYPTIPQIHDAWQQDQQGVLLLEDRSELPFLSDLCHQKSIPAMQVLHWLHEMVELWVALENWRSRRSLLELTNLRVDEDGILCLQRLCADPVRLPAQAPASLQDLGQIWQQLFQASLHPIEASLATLISEVNSGVITSVPELQTRLEAIAFEVQMQNTATGSGSKPERETESDSEFSDLELLDLLTDEALDSGVEEETEAPTVVLPMQLYSLEDACQTDVGKQRNHNEDAFGIEILIQRMETPQGRTLHAKGLYVLCDGMGGHAGGEIASALAVETLKNYFQTQWHDRLPDEATIREGIAVANQALYDINQQKASSGSGRMGTTLVLLLVHDTDIAVAHVGDSRLYRLSRKRGLEQMTLDHEVGQREIQRGVDPAIAYARPDAYQLTQALGPRDSDSIRPDVQFLSLREDSLLLLCSDGLSDNELLDTYWQSHLEPLLSSRASLEAGVSQLIDLANQHNGHDNTTAIVVRIKVAPNLAMLPR